MIKRWIVTLGVMVSTINGFVSPALAQNPRAKAARSPAAASKAYACGELPENACAVLLLAVKAWNARFSQVVHVASFRYQPGAPIEDKSLIETLTGMEAVLPEAGEQDSLRLRKLGEMRVAQKEIEAWRKTLRSVQASSQYAVQLIWAGKGINFSTTALLSDRGQLYDNLLSNVRTARTHNSCADVQILWLWGGVSGEIKLDLVPVYDNNHLSTCKRSAIGWMNLGKTQQLIGDVTIQGDRCSAAYAWAWATPLATISFQDKGFTFSVSGVGSHGSGSGDCVERRQ